MSKKIAIIGSGFSALSASCYLAKQGFDIHMYEKNSTVGGRARQLKREGFTFDIGPSWYWMPDIFERFFNDFGQSTSDFYDLEKLSPAYKIFFQDDTLTIGDTLDKICAEFERIESGSSVPLRKFISKAKKNYEIAIDEIVYRPGLSPLELVTKDTVFNVDQFFKTISSEVRRDFKNQKLISTLEFPVLFLGAKPSNTPAFYSFMNFADFGLGTWHPKGGMYQVIVGMQKLAERLGVTIHTSQNVERILYKENTATGIQVNGEEIVADIILSGADYHHTEQLLPLQLRQYSQKYWQRKTFAPSSLLFYVGFDKKLEYIEHHNLFFDTEFDMHAREIYDEPKWPSKPLFYANFPSVTDTSMAPEDCETGFFLIPLAPDLEDTPQLRQQYFDIIMKRMEERIGYDLIPHVLFKESFCVEDFKEQYNSYKGNAYGMANTLKQTAFLRPGLKSKKVSNLYFTGQLTVPGPGVPPSIISGKLAAQLICKNYSS